MYMSIIDFKTLLSDISGMNSAIFNIIKPILDNKPTEGPTGPEGEEGTTGLEGEEVTTGTTGTTGLEGEEVTTGTTGTDKDELSLPLFDQSPIVKLTGQTENILLWHGDNKNKTSEAVMTQEDYYPPKNQPTI